MANNFKKQPLKTIQPFVPVHGREHTGLYSHRELQAFADSDSRNELDELSEPDRFRKDLSRAGMMPLGATNKLGTGLLLLTFLVGAAAAAAMIRIALAKNAH